MLNLLYHKMAEKQLYEGKYLNNDAPLGIKEDS